MYVYKYFVEGWNFTGRFDGIFVQNDTRIVWLWWTFIYLLRIIGRFFVKLCVASIYLKIYLCRFTSTWSDNLFTFCKKRKPIVTDGWWDFAGGIWTFAFNYSNPTSNAEKKNLIHTDEVLFIWRSRRDLNPRYPFGVHTISSRARYDHFDTAPWVRRSCRLAYNTS